MTPERLVEQVPDRAGREEVLVNNASGLRSMEHPDDRAVWANQRGENVSYLFLLVRKQSGGFRPASDTQYLRVWRPELIMRAWRGRFTERFVALQAGRMQSPRGLIPPQDQPSGDAALVAEHLNGVVVHPNQRVLTLANERQPHLVAWSHRPLRVILVPPGREGERLLPMKREDRARILLAIARGRAWMQGLVSGYIPGTASIAARDKLTERSVRMTLSLAHLAPSIVRAIVEARLPRGIGPRHLAELPSAWA